MISAMIVLFLLLYS